MNILNLLVLLSVFTEGYSQQVPLIPERFHPTVPAGVQVTFKKTGHGKESPGSKKSFFVRNVLDQSKWHSIEFILQKQMNGVNYWIDPISVSNRDTLGVIDSVLNVFNDLMTVRTKTGSLDSSLGIVPLEIKFLSPLPDIDGDGYLDILILDIEDNFEGSGQFIAGFFDPVDQLVYPTSNNRDILYLDLYPTIFRPDTISIDQGAQTLAHELQHLIHSQFSPLENPEWTSINEGCSELTEYLCGFTPRELSYFQANTLEGWYHWDDDKILLSYERSMLFISWYYFRYGISVLSHLIQSNETGTNGLVSVSGEENYQQLYRKFLVDLFSKDLPDTRAVFPSTWQPEFHFGTQERFRFFPVNQSLQLFPGGFTKFRLEMSSTYHLLADSDDELNAWQINPLSGKIEEVKLESGKSVELSGLANEPTDLVIMNPKVPNSEFDRQYATVSLLIDSEPESGITIAQTDDGWPDAFFSQAKFLKIPDSLGGLALKINQVPENAHGVREISLLAGFLSEFEGTGVDSNEPRKFNISFRDSIGNQIGEPVVMAANRQYAQIGFETFYLPYEHPITRYSDSGFWIIISDTKQSANGIAIAMDHSGLDVFRVLDPEGKLVSFHGFFPEDYQLVGFQPMIRPGFLTPVTTIEQSDPFHWTFSKDSIMFYLKPEKLQGGTIVVSSEGGETRETVDEKTPDTLGVYFPLNGVVNIRLDYQKGPVMKKWSAFMVRFPSTHQSLTIPWKANRSFILNTSSSWTPQSGWYGFKGEDTGDTLLLKPVTEPGAGNAVSIRLSGNEQVLGEDVYQTAEGTWFWNLESPIRLVLTKTSSDYVRPFTLQVSEAFPNPFNPETRFEIFSDRRIEGKLSIFNSLGQQLRSESFEADAGRQWITLNFSGYSSGMYFVRMIANNQGQVRRVVLVK